MSQSKIGISEYADSYSYAAYILKLENDYLTSLGYFVLKKIGSGKFSTVHSAEKRSAGSVTKMAVKVIKKSHVPSTYVNKFLPNELSIWPSLRYRHIVECYRSFNFREGAYMFMELVSGGTVREYLIESGAVPEDLARKWGKGMCKALRYCQKKGIAHRDVKCENLLLTKDLKIKLGDFGLCCYETNPKNTMFSSRTFCGSRAYASPELLIGKPYDLLLSDVWSAGVCIFNMLYNVMPFDHTNFQNMQEQQLSKQWTQVSEIEEKVSTNVKNLLNEMLEPNVETRVGIDQVLDHPWMKTHTCQRNKT